VNISPRIKTVSILIIFLLFFASFLSVKLWDFDFWWHIATGRYIVTNHEIPVHDPFSFVTEENRGKFESTSLRERFIMRQYWLAQVIFYYIFQSAGPLGIVITRSVLLTLLLYLVFRSLKFFRVPDAFSLCLIIPVFYLFLHKYTGERPVLFSFIFPVIIFLIIEDYLKTRSRRIYLLPPVMLVWANLHGGFVLGIVIIGVYLAAETLKFLLKRDALGQRDLLVFIGTGVAAIVASALNPNGYLALPMFHPKYNIFTEQIQEYQSLYRMYFSKAMPLAPEIVVVMIIFALVLLARFRRMALSHLLLLLGLFVLAIQHQRFLAFASTVGMAIAGKEILAAYAYLRERVALLKREHLAKVGSLFFLGILIIFAVRISYRLIESDMKLGEMYMHNDAVGAVNFIERNGIQGRMFNSDAFGGYAIWKLYPGKKVFADTRQIDIATTVEYVTIISGNDTMVGSKPLWEKLLDMYNINFAVLKPIHYHGGLNDLIAKMIENDRWVPVYIDGAYFLFVRDSDVNRDIIAHFRISRENGYWAIIRKASEMALANVDNPFLYTAIGKGFRGLGNDKEAVKSFGHALRLYPYDPIAKKEMEEISAGKGPN
jgi:hypothetical protein